MANTAYPRTEALDLLDEAKAMLDFLRDVASPAVCTGLPEDSAHGLGLIMQCIHDKIERAVSLL